MAGHNCDAPLSVKVDGVGLPIIDEGLRLIERKDGPTSMTRRAEAMIPVEAFGETWTDYISAFEDGEVQTATVYGQPVDLNGNPTGQEAALFKGYIGQVGSKNGTNRARFTVFDPAIFLNRIEAGVTFREATVGDVLRWVAKEYVNNQPIFDSLDAAGVLDRQAVREVSGAEASGVGRVGEPVTVPQGNTRPAVFTPNRDVLGDVISWLEDVANVRIWIGPKDGELALFAAGDPSRTYDATDRGDVTLIENDALYELRPINAVRLKGKGGIDIDTSDILGSEVITKQYAESVATYPPLVEKAGGRITETRTTSAVDPEDVETEAKSTLKQLMDEVTGGDMVLALSPQVRPFDILKATPACAGVVADVEPLNYEVQRAIHSLQPDPDNDTVTQIPNTQVAVSMAVDPSLIEVSTTVKDIRPKEQSNNKPGEPFGSDDVIEWGLSGGS